MRAGVSRVPWCTCARIPWRASRSVELAVEHPRRRHRARRGDDVAARDLAPLDPDEVEGDALARAGALDGLVVDLRRARTAHRRARRQQTSASPRRDRARPQRAGDDGAGAADGEGAVDVQQRLAGALAAPGQASGHPSSAPRTSATPAPVRAEHATTVAAAAARAPRAGARAGSARSAFVTATTPSPTPSAASTAACSRVCGITPSSAATTMR